MNKSFAAHNIFISVALLLFLPAGFFASTATAGHMLQKDLIGPSFSNPDIQISMSENWTNKPVVHDVDADLVISLDGQLYKAWIPLINTFASENNLKISISHGTCGVSAGGLSRKKIDIGAFCCPAGRTDRLPGLKYHTAGIAAQALLVHPDNPVENITFEQAQQIFQGIIYRWSKVKNNLKTDRMIKPIGRLHCKIRPGHWRQLLDNKDLFGPDLIEVGAMPDMISQIAGNPGAIGHEVLWVPKMLSNFGKVKFLKINGYSPDMPSDVISGNYPLYRVYSFSTWEGEHTANPHAQKLIDYIIRNAGSLNKKYHFIPASSLRKAGWKFRGNELVGEPW